MLSMSNPIIIVTVNILINDVEMDLPCTIDAYYHQGSGWLARIPMGVPYVNVSGHKRQ